jgi:tetratricopeptide (TPR) repeat protein
LVAFVMLGIIRFRLFMLTVALFVVLCPPMGWSMQNPWIQSPLGSSTVPPSSISNGLVNTPDPVDTTGNLIITGNVRRGMYFHGNVPYQAPTSFSETLGSSTLSSFLRDSAGLEDVGSYAHKYAAQPYYSPTETVTTMTPGRPEVLSPMNLRINGRAQQEARSEGTAAFGSAASTAEPMSFARGNAAELAVQDAQTQYHLFAGSQAAKGTAPEGTSPSPRDGERLTPGGTSREGEMSAAQRFEDQGLDAASRSLTAPADSGLGRGLEPGTSSAERPQHSSAPDTSLQYPSPATSIDNLRPGSETQVPAESTDNTKQSVAAGYGLSRFNELAASTNPTLQEGTVFQKGTNWPGTTQKLLSDQYANSVKNEIAGLARATQSASLPQGSASSQEGAGLDQRDVLERIKQQLDELDKSVEAGLLNASGSAGRTTDVTAVTKSEALHLGSHSSMSDRPDVSSQRQVDSGGVLNPYKSDGASPGFGVEFPRTAGLAPAHNETSALDALKPLSQTDVAAEAKHIMGPHTNLQSFSEAKFNEHIRSAEEQLRAGRYYRAVDAFSLAAVYKPDDPQMLAGQCHALFAAGEYMSSALFLSRVLAVCPGYLQKNVDLVGLLGGRDKLTRRLADVELWYARSGSGQLQLLLGYVYYRTGDLTQARQAIDGAYEKMPELPAVRAMKTAIESAAK